jgi:hypothetical protein
MPQIARLVPWRVRTWLKAVEIFGWGANDYIIAKTLGRPVANLRLRHVGPAQVRVSDSDIECYIQVFSFPYDPESEHHQNRLRDHYSALLKSGRRPVIIDGGANIGAAAAWFSTMRRWHAPTQRASQMYALSKPV